MKSKDHTTVFRCDICGNELLQAHVMLGVCAWCIKNEKQPVMEMPRPHYGFNNTEKWKMN